jgi:hypothetical protein
MEALVGRLSVVATLALTSAGGEQAAQIAIALLADAPELVLAPARVLLRH